MSTQSRSPLLGLLTSQFLGAFNDNAWKYVILTLAMRPVLQEHADTSPEFSAASQSQATLVLLTITLPMVVFSLFGGMLADRLSKRSIMVGMKVMELLLMGGAAASLWVDPDGRILPLVILGLMGVQSALFSPAKYGILPEILPHERLSRGNGLLQMWTMVAIVAGTGLGPVLLLLDGGGSRPEFTCLAPLVLVGCAVAGWVAARYVPPVPAVESSGGLRATVQGGWSAIRSDRVLGLAVMGMIVYWTVISLLGQNIYVYTRAITSGLRSGEILSGLPPAFFAIGIGVGAVVAGKISQNKVEIGLIPLGTLVFSASAVLLGVLRPEIVGMAVLMPLLGVGAGLLIVPLNAILQWRSPDDRRGAVIAVTNVFQLSGIVAGSLGANALAKTALDSGDLLLITALGIVLCSAWAIWLLPAALVRTGLVLLTQVIYRLKVIDRANVPEKGAAVLAPNHTALIDGLFVLASIDRPVRFIAPSKVYNKWWLKPIMKGLGVIEVPAEGGTRAMVRALREAGRSLDEGELVCIFPEGQISRTGALLPFDRELERLVKGRDVSIIPVHLDRVWGSIFSFKRSRFVTKFPERLPYPVTVSFGQALPSGTPIPELRWSLMELGSAAWEVRKKSRRPLHRTFVRATRRRPWRFAMADAKRPFVSRLGVLTGAILLSRALRRRWAEQPRVGILLPPSVAGAMVNLAASLAGRSSVNLNYTSGAAGMESATRQAGLKSLVTSRAFIEKAGVSPPDGLEVVWLEDLAGELGMRGKLTAVLLGLLSPVGILERACGASERVRLDDDVTVIFSSGSTGEPKGVMLSHYNVDSNGLALSEVFNTGKDDRLLGILPLFHSFGFMAMWYGLNHGIGTVFHPNPLDAEAVGQLVEKYRITMMIATPTFLQLYLRRCSPGTLASLEVVLTGAEKLHPRLADAFEKRFGIRPIEGYGTTECSPAISVSTLHVRKDGVYQSGSSTGSVGRALPGVSIRIVDPDSRERLGVGEPGLLMVKGPNVMRGYLGRENLTREVLRDGWYVTGDIALMDTDGFLHITDRLSRFSKIGGEMVPHGRVEEALHEAADVREQQVFAVTAIPDEKKGERLAVLHTFDEDKIPDLIKKLGNSGLPNLFLPRADQFISVDELPVLGSGKIDLRAIKQIAVDRHHEGS